MTEIPVLRKLTDILVMPYHYLVVVRRASLSLRYGIEIPAVTKIF